MPQDQLGVAVGLDETTASARMSRYETGVHEPPLDISNRIAQVLGVSTAYLYCEDDDLAEVILAWSKLARGGRAQAKKLCWDWCLGVRVERLGSRYDGMSAGLDDKRSLTAYRYRHGRLLFSDNGKPPEAAGKPSARVS